MDNLLLYGEYEFLAIKSWKKGNLIFHCHTSKARLQQKGSISAMGIDSKGTTVREVSEIS